MSDTPRTDFVAHESGDPEWNRFPNRFARMMAHACILELELKSADARLHELAVHIQKLEEDIGWATKEREIGKLKNLLGACRCHIDNQSFDEEGDLTRDVDRALGQEGPQ